MTTTRQERENPAPWFDRSRLGIAGALVLVVAVLLAVSCVSNPLRYAGPADEGYYRSYVEVLSQHGLGSYPDVFAQYLSNQKHWLFPSPVRIAFYVPAALLAEIFSPSYELLTGISITSHALLVGILFLGASRHFGRSLGMGTALLVACSPLLLGLGRRALSDSYATLWAMLAVWLYLDLVHEPSSRRAWVAFTLCFVVGILAKETTVLLGLPFLAWPMVQHRLRPPRRAMLSLIGALVVSAALAGLAYLTAAGGWEPFSEVVHIIVTSPAANEYAIKYGSGPWYRYLVDLLLLSPLPFILALAMAARVACGDSVHQLPMMRFFLVLSAGILIAYSPFTKNIRYVALLIVPMALLAASCVQAASQRCPARYRRTVFALVLALLCVVELLSFRRIFLEENVYDPVTYRLLLSREMVPRPEGGSLR